MVLERRPVIAGNWKMHTTVDEAVALVRQMKVRLESFAGVDRVVCPPFVSLVTVSEELAGSPVRVGAQNMHHEPKGAFTGEISPAMLRGLCEYVILGHSERRQYFCETDESVNLKLRTALASGFTPIVCVGERLEENEAGRTEEVVDRQVRGAFAGIEDLQGTIIAYEPVWAIGTGRAATGDQASATIDFIRRIVSQTHGAEAARSIRIQYGGSVNGGNIAEFIGRPGIDGALVGGASLKADEFVSIVEQTARLKGV